MKVIFFIYSSHLTNNTREFGGFIGGGVTRMSFKVKIKQTNTAFLCVWNIIKIRNIWSECQSQMFRLRHFTVSWKILAHFEIDGSNTSLKNQVGQQKAGNLSGTKKK